MRTRPRSVLLGSALVVLALVATLPASAHEERDARFPSGEAGVPSARDTGPYVVVCKDHSNTRFATLPDPVLARNQALLAQCMQDGDGVPGFRHIQQAVDWVRDNGEPGYRILVLPGTYREEPSLAAARSLADKQVTIDGETKTCQQILEESTGDEGEADQPNPGEDEGGNARGTAVLSYEQQLACPHIHNLILVAGDDDPGDDDISCNNNLCDLQIEGTGVRPEDVTIDGDFSMLNGVRADRADGFVLRNLTTQRFEFNAVYVMETDGFLIDSVLSRYNDEYAYLTFSADHGLYENCEGYGNGDSVVYPGSASDINSDRGLIEENEDEFRWATEIRACRGHHSALGYSGTAGNAVWVHHNEFDHNSAGAAMDSLFPDHPGLPQDHAMFEDNVFHENNVNYYAKYLDTDACRGPFRDRGYDDGVVCPTIPLPVGTGLVLAGGNYNLYRENSFFDNWRQGTYQFFVPAYFRGEEDPTLQFDTSHFNTYRDNRMGENAVSGATQPNGVDFAWDGEGEGNCWQGNTSAAGDVTYSIVEANGSSTAPTFPGCDDRMPRSPVSSVVLEAGCVEFDRDDNPEPAGCDWFEDPSVPEGRTPDAPVLQRVAGADRVATSIVAAREGFPGFAPTVVLARADAFPDALSGAPLARALDGPMLLTNGASLDPRVAAEIRRLGANRVVLLGGPAALSAQVAADLRAMGVPDVDRIAGADRFATSVAIARVLGATNAFIAKGADANPDRAWPDAVAASPAAALLERPILLTAGDRLPPVLDQYLATGQVTSVELVGGEAAISPAVAAAVGRHLCPSGQDACEDVERLAGEDRFATSLAVADYLLETEGDATELWLTTGGNWPDGIAAGSAISVDEGIMLLAPDELAGSPVETWLEERHPFSVDSGDVSVADVVERVRVLGGPAAVPDAVLEEIRSMTGARDGDAKGDRSTGNVIRGGSFSVLPGAGSGYQDVTGYAVMERRLDGTTRTRVYVRGLPTAVGTMHPVHAHAEPCAFRPVADNPHYMVDTDGEAMEPNEIHPMFATGPGGTGVGDSTVMHIAGEGTDTQARSVMIHSPDGTKQLCADLR